MYPAGKIDCVRDELVRGTGLALALGYAALIIWIYARQPATLAQVTGGVTSAIGAYRIDDQSFTDGLAFFRRDQFEAARSAFARADPAERDARTQFYVAYSYYRQGWHRFYSDDRLFGEGLKAIDKAIDLAPDRRLIVEDPNLLIHSGDELRAELRAGLTQDASDLNPLRVLGARK